MYARSYSLDSFNKIDRNRWHCATSALYRRMADRRSFQNVKKCILAALILPQHETLHPIGLILARIKILHMGTFLLSKMNLNVITVKLFLY